MHDCPINARLGALLAPRAAMPAYRVLAFRYGTCWTTRGCCFRGYERDPERETPLQMDFFLWVIRDDQRTIVVDTGFDPQVGERRRRVTLTPPTDALCRAGIEAATVEQLILTHLHYDHVGNLGAFARASIYLHRRELEFWQGAGTRPPSRTELVEPADLAAIESARRRGRVSLIDGDAEIAPGVLALWTGGHAPGQMVVVVQGGCSLVVLASDALHYYEELEQDRQFAICSDAQEMRAAYDLLYRLAEQGAVIVPGHDPLVFERFGRAEGGLAELAVVVG